MRKWVHGVSGWKGATDSSSKSVCVRVCCATTSLKIVKKRGRINSPLITYSENCIILTLIGYGNLVRKFAIVICSNLHDGIRMNWSGYEGKTIEKLCHMWWCFGDDDNNKILRVHCSSLCVHVFRGKCNVVTANHVRWLRTQTHTHWLSHQHKHGHEQEPEPEPEHDRLCWKPVSQNIANGITSHTNAHYTNTMQVDLLCPLLCSQKLSKIVSVRKHVCVRACLRELNYEMT